MCVIGCVDFDVRIFQDHQGVRVARDRGPHDQVRGVASGKLNHFTQVGVVAYTLQLAESLVEYETLDGDEVKRVIKGEPIRGLNEVLDEKIHEAEEADASYVPLPLYPLIPRRSSHPFFRADRSSPLPGR